jgi:hypothetical protein
MKCYVKVRLLLSGIFLVFAMFSYFHEASSMGFLQIMNYPLRPYTVPLSILGFLFRFSSIVVHKIFQ